MNFLESLVLRTLDAAPTVEPPRVPYISVFPVEEASPSIPDAGVADNSGAPRQRPAIGRTRPPADARPVDEAPAVQHAAVPAQPPRVAPRAAVRSKTAEDDGEKSDARVERIIGERDVVRREIVESPRSDGSSGDAVSVPPAAVPPEVREVHHAHHHYWIERSVERIVREVEGVVVTPTFEPPAAPRPDARRDRVERSESRRPEPPAREFTPVLAAPRETPPVPAEPSPVVHVTIGRVTVRLQQPAAAARTDTTRPAPPALGLDEYTAARRGSKR